MQDILDQLQSNDPSLEYIALQSLADKLALAEEESLALSGKVDSIITELLRFVRCEDSMGGLNPETLILSNRCLVNLMEAMHGASRLIVYKKGVEALCQNILAPTDYVDIKENAISVNIISRQLLKTS